VDTRAKECSVTRNAMIEFDRLQRVATHRAGRAAADTHAVIRGRPTYGAVIGAERPRDFPLCRRKTIMRSAIRAVVHEGTGIAGCRRRIADAEVHSLAGARQAELPAIHRDLHGVVAAYGRRASAASSAGTGHVDRHADAFLKGLAAV